MHSITIITGHVARDPDIRKTDDGQQRVLVIVTTERAKKVGEKWETEYQHHRVVAEGYASKSASKLKKGKLVTVQGYNQSRKYKDKAGIEREVTEVIAERVRLLEKPPKPPSGTSRTSYGGVMPMEVNLSSALCPTCGKALDGATPIGEDRGPIAGDVSICAYCGECLEYFSEPPVLRKIRTRTLNKLCAHTKNQFRVLRQEIYRQRDTRN